MTEPLIPLGQVPRDVGLLKMRQLSFSMDMTDEQMRAKAEEAIAIRNTYSAWQEFHDQLDLRKKRLLGFQAVVLALDVTAAAAAMQTTPELVTAVMNGHALEEQARVAELEALWVAGTLPDRPVLTDPSQDVIGGG